MGRTIGKLIFRAAMVAFVGKAYSQSCDNLPTQFTGNQFPTGNFFSNFNNSCYLISFATGHGGDGLAGDLNSVYNMVFFKVDSRYELIVLGPFPNARFFSVTLYDAHSAESQNLTDFDIQPLTSAYVNPFEPNIAWEPGQQYAIPVELGGTPDTQQTGCTMSGFSVYPNELDGTLRHTGLEWNTDKSLFQAYPTFPDHVVDTPEHTNPNTAGLIMVRSYLDITPVGASYSPHLIVRDVASGCAYPASYAINTLKIVTSDSSAGGEWLDYAQSQSHSWYQSTYLPQLGYATNPSSAFTWLRSPEYVSGTNPDASYVDAFLPGGLAANLASAGKVMRLRFHMPAVPPTPCPSGCSRSGNEQLRYASVSFQAGSGDTLASLADNAFTKDPNGYVTLIVGTGAQIPSWITPANGYTYLNLTSISDYQQLSSLMIRNILRASTFNCSGSMVPYNTAEYTPAGGLMGGNAPIADYPVAVTLPQTASELHQPDSCGVFPDGDPGTLPNPGVFLPAPIAIASVVTQCPEPGCTSFNAQSRPPITITGVGFGNFPGGMPYTGASNYLEIADVTQGWDAGYATDTCQFSFSSWTDKSIQLVANISLNGSCSLVAGDQLTVNVWNPQTMAEATINVTVADI
jgi:hypothetical protein